MTIIIPEWMVYIVLVYLITDVILTFINIWFKWKLKQVHETVKKIEKHIK